MRVLLIRPPRIKKAITIGEFMFSEPIGLEMVYQVIHQDHDVEIFDMMVDQTTLETKLKVYKPDVIAVTSLCIDVFKVLHICQEAKRINPNILTAVGGTQTYLNPQAFMEASVDFIFKFSTRDNIQSFYKSLSTNKSIAIDGILTKEKSYSETFENQVNEYIVPNRKSTSSYRSFYSYFGYKPVAIMGLAQGCDKQCRFCLRWRIEGGNEKVFDTDLIEEDLLNIEEDTIMIFDNDMISSSEKIHMLCDLLEKNNLKKRFIGYGSVKAVMDNKEAIKRFKKNGLVALLVGYESFSEIEMEYYQKKSKVSDNLDAAAFLKEQGIDVWASFMAHPKWDKADFKAFRKYVKALKPQVGSLSPLTPFPNLPLYEEYKDRIIYNIEDYEKWSFGQVMIRPYNMTLRQYYFELLKTNLYVNIFVNNMHDLIKKFGMSSIIRLTLGSIKTFNKYVKLMLQADKMEASAREKALNQ